MCHGVLGSVQNADILVATFNRRRRFKLRSVGSRRWHHRERGNLLLYRMPFDHTREQHNKKRSGLNLSGKRLLFES
jgi:hypothetical protein